MFCKEQVCIKTSQCYFEKLLQCFWSNGQFFHKSVVHFLNELKIGKNRMLWIFFKGLLQTALVTIKMKKTMAIKEPKRDFLKFQKKISNKLVGWKDQVLPQIGKTVLIKLNVTGILSLLCIV